MRRRLFTWQAVAADVLSRCRCSCKRRCLDRRLRLIGGRLGLILEAGGEHKLGHGPGLCVQQAAEVYIQPKAHGEEEATGDDRDDRRRARHWELEVEVGGRDKAEAAELEDENPTEKAMAHVVAIQYLVRDTVCGGAAEAAGDKPKEKAKRQSVRNL
eukprot:scaffold100546_cov51-Phaeocystis_antarctica.AAC.2